MQWRSFVSSSVSNDGEFVQDEEEICKLISTCGKTVTNNEKEELLEAFVNLTSIIPPLKEKFDAFKDFETGISQTFNLWNQYIKMVHIMLNFIRVERIRDWELHLEAVTHMLPYFFAYDRTNYSRWTSVYLIDMRKLKYTAPEVYQEFHSGNHPVKRSNNSTFNHVWTDMGLEQSLNRDSKTSGGIVWIHSKTRSS